MTRAVTTFHNGAAMLASVWKHSCNCLQPSMMQHDYFKLQKHINYFRSNTQVQIVQRCSNSTVVASASLGTAGNQTPNYRATCAVQNNEQRPTNLL